MAPETSANGAGVWIGLLVAVLLLLETGTPPQTVIFCLLLVGGTLLAALRFRIGWLAIGVLVLCGFILRQHDAGPVGFSDVLTVTRAAIEQVLAGGNPYGHGFTESTPPGSPYAYGPLALVWYLPVQSNPVRLELWIARVLILVLAARGRVLGLAIYAVLPALVATSHDGSNDTSAGLLILVALLVAERGPAAGGALLGVAAAFKPYALAWVAPLAAYGGVVPIVMFAGASLVLWVPAVLAFGASNIVSSFQRADSIHVVPYDSLAYGFGTNFVVARNVLDALRFAAGLAVAAGSWFLVRTARSFVLAGVGVFLVTLYLGWWSTVAYIGAIAPIVCWHIDDWLGLPRVRWPGDPIGALTAVVDRRWPVRTPWPDDGLLRRAGGGTPAARTGTSAARTISR